MGDGLADGLAQARALGLGYILANQYLGQLPLTTQAAVLGTVRSTVVFQLDHDDARTLERRFGPLLSVEDLMGLGTYEIAARLCVDGQTRQPVTGKTQPLEEPIRDAFALSLVSRERYGMPRADVEAALRARVPSVETVTTFGRRKGVAT